MLKEKFHNLMQRYTEDTLYVKQCWDEIEKAYSSPSRHYHSLTHLENMILGLDTVRDAVEDLDSLLFAIYYHDIVYKATKSDNEYQSAITFKQRISKTTFDSVDTVFTHIEATKAHQRSSNNDTNILLDLDLSILGADPDVYNQYAANIRKEYKIYPDFMYLKGRKKVLKHMLEMPAIFKTDCFINTYEKQARINLQSELEGL